MIIVLQRLLMQGSKAQMQSRNQNMTPLVNMQASRTRTV